MVGGSVFFKILDLTDELFGFAGYVYYLQGFFLKLHNVTELVCTNLSLI